MNAFTEKPMVVLQLKKATKLPRKARASSCIGAAEHKEVRSCHRHFVGILLEYLYPKLAAICHLKAPYTQQVSFSLS